MKFSNKSFSSLAFLLILTLLGLRIDAVAQNKSTSEILVAMERRGDIGSPTYSVQIYDDGTVVYNGKSRVGVIGKRQYKISLDKVRDLTAEFERINFFSLKERYESNVSSSESTTTTLSLNGKKKSVINEGDFDELYKLEDKIDEIADLTKFIILHTLKARLDRFYKELNDNPTAKGFIINYGNKRQIYKREEDLTGGIKFRLYDINRIKFVRRLRNSRIKTEFRIVNGDRVTNH